MDENLVNVTDEGVDINVGGVSNFARFTDKSLGDNFQYLKDTTRKKVLGVGNDFFKQHKQELADNGFNPVSGADAFKPDVVDNESDNIVSGTQGDRDDVTLTSQDADNAIGDAEAGTESPNAVLERLGAERERINTTTQTELDSIEQAGEDAGAAYQSIVDEQEENRKQTMASEVVRAGEKGGFLSTQQAGTAALLATDGKKGEAFVGTGGALDRKRQTLDRAVALAKAKQQEAIANAKAARSTAITSNKREDYQLAVDSAKLAQDFKNDAEDLKLKKRQLELSESAEDRAWNADTRANSAEGRDAAGFALDQATKYFNIVKDLKEGETIVVGDITFEGLKTSDVKPFWTSSAIVSLAKEIPVGETRYVDDPALGRIPIEGLQTNDPSVKSVQSYDDAGNLTITSYKLNADGSMDITGQSVGGKVGKTKTQASNVTLNMNNAEKSDLTQALSILDATKGEKYNSNKVSEQYKIYNQAHPGKGDQLLEAIKGDVNYGDQVIKELYDVKADNSETIKITTPSGTKIEM